MQLKWVYMGCGWDTYIAWISIELPKTFTEMLLIHFRFGENWALLGHKISIGHADFFP
jgi:hypothetical protein